MLAFDIETTGLKPESCEVTCICACDTDAGVALTIIPPLGQPVEPFFALLDCAERLCAFNGVRFDLPFLQARSQLSMLYSSHPRQLSMLYSSHPRQLTNTAGKIWALQRACGGLGAQACRPIRGELPGVRQGLLAQRSACSQRGTPVFARPTLRPTCA